MFTGIVAAVVAVVGLILLSINVNATTEAGGTVACGTGFKTDTSQAAHDTQVDALANAIALDHGQYGLVHVSDSDGYVAACDSALSTHRGVGFPLLGVGVIALIGSVVVRRIPTSATPTQQLQTPQPEHAITLLRSNGTPDDEETVVAQVIDSVSAVEAQHRPFLTTAEAGVLMLLILFAGVLLGAFVLPNFGLIGAVLASLVYIIVLGMTIYLLVRAVREARNQPAAIASA
ncbi:hypothetical protein [Amycolatopsis sp. NPDC051372]|uniref:hypothetical protein n=1 Tax=Amycolatopsis sp. NPDC051372 TaxID=3155669 RepID=UPI00342B4256